MKKFGKLIRPALSLIAALLASFPVCGFTYTYEGQTLSYTILDEDAKTCETASSTYTSYGQFHPGNNVSGTLVIPSTVKYGDKEYTVVGIGKESFYKNVGLTSLTLPNTLTYIDESAFAVCEGLTSLTLPNSVALIDYMAFWCCTGLKTVTFSTSLTRIGMKAFFDCESLESVVIPASVTQINTSAFHKCTSLTEVDILGNLDDVSYEAFSECSNLKTVNFHGRVKAIASSAFSGCDAIENVGLGNLISNFTVNTIFPALVKEKLKSVEIYESASIVVESAFQGCANLTSVKFDTKNLTEIQALAFQGCTKLGDIELPEGLEEIGDGAFGNCRRLSTLKLPNSLLTLGEGAFEQCFDLTEITVGDNLKYFGDAFGENNLQRLTIGKAIERLTVAKFTDDPGRLKSLILPEGIETIGLNAAKGCRGLREIEFPGTLKTIDGEAFSGCDGLIELTIPNSVTEIRYDAFYGCDGLEVIRIGNGLKRIGQKAFQNCHPLEIYVNSQNPPRGYFTANEDGMDKNTFNDYTATLYVPASAIEAYKADSMWKNFTNVKPYEFSGVDGIGIDPEGTRCFVDGRTIIVETQGEGPVGVYDVSGKQCFLGEPAGEMIRFTPSHSGVFIVRCGTFVKKVVVK